MTPDLTRLCVTCLHIGYVSEAEAPFCLVKIKRASLVTGQETVDMPRYCHVMREGGQPCGPGGTLWEAKP